MRRLQAIDMHCDSISELLNKERRGLPASLRENEQHLDLKRMRDCGYLLQNFAMFVDKCGCADPWTELCALYEKYEKEMAANADWIRPVRCFADLEANIQANVLSAMLTVEEGAVLGGSMERLHALYDMGVRMMTLTWNYENEIGYPNTDLQKVEQGLLDNPGYTPDVVNGLTAFGKDVVAEMESLGMIVDVSHLSDAGFYDVLDCATKPFVASHSNARSVCSHVRNLTDDMIRKLAERGGVTGLNFYANFLGIVPGGGEIPGTLASIVAHARHIYQVGGLEVLCLGSDFDGITTNASIRGVEDMGQLWEALHQGGFTERELDHIFYKNVIRVYKDTLK